MISLCITTYNRTDLLFESFSQVINDDRISEIVIVDDCSDEHIYNTVVWYCKDITKVKLYRNEINLDCYRNKREAVSKATNEWVIVWDSDNIMTRSYLDAIEKALNNMSLLDIRRDIIFQPCFAKPHFNFKNMEGKFVSRGTMYMFINDPTFQTMLNAMNYFVNRDEYLKVWDGSIDPVTSDSLYQNYRWISAGNSIYVVPGLEYDHRVHDQSHYKNNVRRTPRGFHEDIIQRLKNMR